MEEERTPLSSSKRQAQFPRLAVKVEGFSVGPEKEATDVGGTGFGALPQSSSVCFRQRKSDVGGHYRVFAVQLVDMTPVASEPG
ncbi:MAG: hypothetical protein WCB19_01005 [Thermoplasmata archaeon]